MSCAGILPVAILLGLASVPTECRCGAEQPHAHSLFTLPGHDHSDHRHNHVEAVRRDATADQAAAAPNTDESAYALTTGTTSMAGRTAALFVPSGSIVEDDATAEQPASDNGFASTGILDSPEPPPPR